MLDLWQERFGIISDHFEPYNLVSTSKTTYLIKKSMLVKSSIIDNLQMAGIPFVKQVGRFPKPATCAVQRFGNLATKNSLNLTKENLVLLCKEGEIVIHENFSSGYIIVRTGEAVWGACLFLEPERLLCRFPKNLAKAMGHNHLNNIDTLNGSATV